MMSRPWRLLLFSLGRDSGSRQQRRPSRKWSVTVGHGVSIRQARMSFRPNLVPVASSHSRMQRDSRQSEYTLYDFII